MKRKNENGTVVVEALIVVTIAMMFITVMLYLGIVLYQQAVVNIMANQTASGIAQIYGNTLRDPFTGYVDAEGVHETVTYANIRNQAYHDVIEQKTDALAMYRLKSSRILNTGKTEVDIDIIPKNNELLKEQIVVTIRDTYKVSLVSFFGIRDNELTFEGTGRADCVDLLDYFAGIPALGTNDGNAVIFTQGQECMVNFYEHYTDTRPIKTVTVLQGHSVNSSAEKSHSTMPSKPIQEQMRFVKWITEDGHTFNADSVVNSDMNVYGIWECTVTFDPDGGTVNTTSKVATVTGNVTLPVAQRENCTFAGWYTEKNGEGEEFTGANVQGDITVYAKWVCNVIFNPDGGEVTPDSVEVIYGKSLQESGLRLPTPTRADCTFDNWYTERYGEGTMLTETQAIQGHTVVIAKWNCKVNLVANGGTVPNTTIDAVVGKSIELPVPDRDHNGTEGWQFAGWYGSEDFVGNMHSAGEYVVEGTVTLYAKWSCNHKLDYTRALQTYTATRCTKQSYKVHKCKYCDFTETKYGARGECRNGHCGGRHYYADGNPHPWRWTEIHKVECTVYWYACWECPDCHDLGGAVCGTCITNYGYGVNCKSHGVTYDG